LNIVIDNIEQFKVFFNVIYDMASDLVELQLFPDRMSCAMLDKTRTRFFCVDYEAKFFDVYAVDDVESVVVFIEDIYNLLKSTNKSDTLYLQLNDPYLVAKIESTNGNTRVFEFVLPTDVVESPVPPHADFPAVFTMDVSDIKQSIKDINVIGSDLLKFVVSKDSLNIVTDSDIATKYANNVSVEVDVDETISSGFTLEYISQLSKFEKISKQVELKLGNDFPVFYNFRDELMGVSINGMIAPRLPVEEE
jgi:hypothetical protein